MKTIKILFIVTSHDKLGNTDNSTGAWLEEIAAPYYIFREKAVSLTLVSPKGGLVPLDPKSQSIIVATPAARQFLKDGEAMSFLSHSSLLEEANADDFDGVYIPGGHGPLWDIAGNKKVQQLLEAFNRQNKPIASVCHGVAALLSIQNENGEPVVKNKQVTGFSNSEEQSAGLTNVVPLLVETELVALGASYSKAANYMSHVVTDGNIITGQNAASSEGVAKKMIALLLLHPRAAELQPVVDNTI